MYVSMFISLNVFNVTVRWFPLLVAHRRTSCPLPLQSPVTQRGFSSGPLPRRELSSAGWLQPSAASPTRRSAPPKRTVSRSRSPPGIDSWRTPRAGAACCAWSGAAYWRHCGLRVVAAVETKKWIQSFNRQEAFSPVSLAKWCSRWTAAIFAGRVWALVIDRRKMFNWFSMILLLLHPIKGPRKV